MSDSRIVAGAVAPAVWLAGAGAMSWWERDFMAEDIGWDVWPSGLALGPDGWGQIAVFLVFSGALLVFARALLGAPSPSRPARVGSWCLASAAAVSVLLAFRTDPPGGDVTWHGVLHAVGYAGMMLGLLAGMALSYPARVRGASASQWALAPAALLLLPGAWLMPAPEATTNYLFFAVPFVLLAALALRLARD